MDDEEWERAVAEAREEGRNEGWEEQNRANAEYCKLLQSKLDDIHFALPRLVKGVLRMVIGSRSNAMGDVKKYCISAYPEVEKYIDIEEFMDEIVDGE
jgi:hypothetical protein